MNNQDPTIKDVMEVVTFIRDNAFTKDEATLRFDALREQMRDETHTIVAEAKNDIMSSVDGFIKLHEKLDIELTSLRAKYDRLESYIHQLAKHANLELA